MGRARAGRRRAAIRQLRHAHMIAPWLSRRQTFRALTVSASDMSRKGVWEGG